ncbi:hypothetical protein M422DRAFT_164013 [Sphaerobolus stellatus SS14]|nr:hypothetical protein M422DRAFT_164009 [Sphaerobolus stellatus SS14]KIJ47455.1 hypothetical protein M422DRAFT_164013 [Sphaerobolus stellatus SS14]
MAGINTLLKACTLTPHGHDDKTVYDASYHLAKELLHTDFALAQDILAQNPILEDVSELTSKRISGCNLVAEPYKHNADMEGGFFKVHHNTPKSSEQVGTLIICLPSAFTGGSPRIRHKGQDQIINWAKAASNFQGYTLPWVFLFSDVACEVYPITSGVCLTLTYDVFSAYSGSLLASVMDAPQTTFIDTLNKGSKIQSF